MVIESDEAFDHSDNELENQNENEMENENENESHHHHHHHHHHHNEDDNEDEGEDEDDAILESHLGKRRRTSSVLESTVDSYLQWIDGPCGFPVVFDPFASASSMDLVDEAKLNYILRPEYYSYPAKYILRSSEFLPSLCVIVDAQIMKMPPLLREQMKAFGADLVEADLPLTPEESDLFDEIRDVFRWRFLSMHYCKTRKWKSQHNESTEVPLSECFELFKNKGNNDANCPWYPLFHDLM